MTTRRSIDLRNDDVYEDLTIGRVLGGTVTVEHINDRFRVGCRSEEATTVLLHKDLERLAWEPDRKSATIQFRGEIGRGRYLQVFGKAIPLGDLREHVTDAWVEVKPKQTEILMESGLYHCSKHQHLVVLIPGGGVYVNSPGSENYHGHRPNFIPEQCADHLKRGPSYGFVAPEFKSHRHEKYQVQKSTRIPE